jgi:hypothetical protein
MRIELFIGALLAALVAFDVAITVAVARSDVYSPRQKAMQAALVWLVPVLGTVLVGVVLWSDRVPRGPRHAADGHDGEPSGFDSAIFTDAAAGAGDMADAFHD